MVQCDTNQLGIEWDLCTCVCACARVYMRACVQHAPIAYRRSSALEQQNLRVMSPRAGSNGDDHAQGPVAPDGTPLTPSPRGIPAGFGGGDRRLPRNHHQANQWPADEPEHDKHCNQVIVKNSDQAMKVKELVTRFRDVDDWLASYFLKRLAAVRCTCPWASSCFTACMEEASTLHAIFDVEEMQTLAKCISDWTAVQACEKHPLKKDLQRTICVKVKAGLEKKKWHAFSDNIQKHMDAIVAVASAEK